MLRALLLILSLAGALSAADPRWTELATLDAQRGQLRARIDEAKVLIQVLGQTVPKGTDAALDAARAALDQTEAAHREACQKAGVEASQIKLSAAQAQRDAAVDALLATCQPYQDLLNRSRQAQTTITALSARIPGLSAEDAKTLAQARREQQAADGPLYGLRKALWDRAEIIPLQNTVAAIYKKHGELSKQVATAPAVKAARLALDEALRVAGAASPAGLPVAKALAEDEKALLTLDETRTAKSRALHGEWTSFTATLPAPPAPATAKKPPAAVTASVELPVGCQRVRGLLFTFMGAVKNDTHVRSVLTAQGFGVVHLGGIGICDREADQQLLLTALDALAKASQHPEVAFVPWVTAGCSASTLTARNIAAWKPERTVAIISFAGGNLHQSAPGLNLEERLTGVPLLAINGEFECCGPDGGNRGEKGMSSSLRTEYGRQTQWVGIREQLRRWREKDPAKLVSLLVIAGADHAKWSGEVSPLTALFIDSAIRARLPADGDLPTAPVTCAVIDPASGWLTPMDLCTPKDPPAPAKGFAGKSDTVFWHASQELAQAVMDYHKGRFILPDPTLTTPLPANWPPRPPATKP